MSAQSQSPSIPHSNDSYHNETNGYQNGNGKHRQLQFTKVPGQGKPNKALTIQRPQDYQSARQIHTNQSPIRVKANSQLQSPFKKKKQLDQLVTRAIHTQNLQIKHIDKVPEKVNDKRDSKEFYRLQDYFIDDLIASINDDTLSFSNSFKENLNITYQFLPVILSADFDQTQVDIKRIQIPRKEGLKYNKTIIFDLDETLVHCNEDDQQESQVYIDIQFPTGEEVKAGINIRQFAKQIIQKLSKICEVIIFTASHECYANKVIDYLDDEKLLTARMFRDSCVQVEQYYVKNLDVIDRDPKNVVIVDNSTYSFAHQLNNGIPIISYYDDKKDSQLIKLYRFLEEKILPAEDVRPVIQNYFKMDQLNNYDTLQEAVESLYF